MTYLRRAKKLGVSLPFDGSGVTEGLQRVQQWLVHRLGDTPDGGPTVVAGIGIGHLVVAAWNFYRETQELNVDIGPLAAAILIGSVSALICLSGYWLWHSELAARGRWIVAFGTVIGGVVVGGIVYLSILVRLSEGRAVGEPLFVLSLASSQGALAGVLITTMYGRAVREAAAARRRRDQIEFVTGLLRHDVSNSMTVIRSRAEMIANGETDQEAEFAETIVDRSEKVIGLSNRVKEIVSVMASDEALERKPVDLTPVVESQLAVIGGDGVTFETDLEDVTVLADELLAEVVGNLLENALAHGVDDEGVVSVTTESIDDRVQLRIADTGDGVPEDQREAIFQRGVSSGTDGFGLYFVKTMVDHYGGNVWVEDRSDGRPGAVFIVELDTASPGMM